MTAQMVASAGVHLNVRSSGNTDGPTVVLLHGFPDNQGVWDRIVPLLETQFHVVTYDVRGAGGSSAPASRKGYRMSRLVDDLVAVIERVRPDGGPVHLVGHDWGSVQMWGAVMRESTDQRLAGRLASYTSISGPGLDLCGNFVASSLRHREVGQLVSQIAHSWYVVAFQLPFVPEFVFRRLEGRIRASLSRKRGRRGSDNWSQTLAADWHNGLNLYRANSLSYAKGTTKVPVQLIVPTKDAFVIPAVYADVAKFAPKVRRVDIVASHWVVRTHPEVIAQKVAAFVEEQR